MTVATPAASSIELQPEPDPGSQAPSFSSSLFTTAIALGFVLALAWLLLRFLKRLQAGRTRHQRGADEIPRVLQSVALGPQQRLVTARYRGREYLLGVTAGAISVIDATHVAAPDSTIGV